MHHEEDPTPTPLIMQCDWQPDRNAGAVGSIRWVTGCLELDEEIYDLTQFRYVDLLSPNLLLSHLRRPH